MQSSFKQILLKEATHILSLKILLQNEQEISNESEMNKIILKKQVDNIMNDVQKIDLVKDSEVNNEREKITIKNDSEQIVITQTDEIQFKSQNQQGISQNDIKMKIQINQNQTQIQNQINDIIISAVSDMKDQHSEYSVVQQAQTNQIIPFQYIRNQQNPLKSMPKNDIVITETLLTTHYDAMSKIKKSKNSDKHSNKMQQFSELNKNINENQQNIAFQNKGAKGQYSQLKQAIDRHRLNLSIIKTVDMGIPIQKKLGKKSKQIGQNSLKVQRPTCLRPYEIREANQLQYHNQQTQNNKFSSSQCNDMREQQNIDANEQIMSVKDRNKQAHIDLNIPYLVNKNYKWNDINSISLRTQKSISGIELVTERLHRQEYKQRKIKLTRTSRGNKEQTKRKNKNIVEDKTDKVSNRQSNSPNQSQFKQEKGSDPQNIGEVLRHAKKGVQGHCVNHKGNQKRFRKLKMTNQFWEQNAKIGKIF